MFGLFKRHRPVEVDVCTFMMDEQDAFLAALHERHRRANPEEYAKLDAATAFLKERLSRVARAHATDLMKTDLTGHDGAAQLRRLERVTKTMSAGIISACDAMYGRSITDRALTLTGRSRSEFH